MSSQLFTCAPRTFFVDCDDISPRAESREFCHAIKRETGVVLHAWSWRRGMCEDFKSSTLMEMTDVLHAAELPCADAALGGDLCIPSGQAISKRIVLPWSWYTGKRNEEMFVTSTADFSAALDAAQPLLESGMKDFADLKGHLDGFRDVIAYAEKHRFPLFWSV
jgi:hypothetical protein